MSDNPDFFSDFLNDQEELEHEPATEKELDLEKLSEEFDETHTAESPYEDRQAETATAEQVAEEEDFDVNPTSILEGMLFVGEQDNQELTAKQMAALMRGVSESDIEELVAELNEGYQQEGAPYEIIPENGGYRMVLDSAFEKVRNRFYRAEKPARLSQNVVDVLALVAYLQPVTKALIEEKRLKPSSSILNQLVRRKLIQLERIKKKGEKTKTLYRTTERFLDLFDLDSLDDLPKSQTFDSPG